VLAARGVERHGVPVDVRAEAVSDGRLYLFPDTNVFLEFLFFDEIDWRAVAGRDATLIVVTRPVITELDRNKSENRSPKKRERARTSLRKFEEHHRGDAKLRNGAAFELWAKNPTIVDGIDASYPDDLLIASAVHFRDERGVDVAIVTGDLGVRVEAFGLPALMLDEAQRRPHEQDDLTIRLGKLEAQLAAKPAAKLLLTYADGSVELTKRFFRYSEKSNNEIDTEVRAEYAKRSKRGEALDLPWDQGQWAKGEIRYLRALRAHEARQHVTFAVELLLRNTGAAPADDIHIGVEVPKRFEIALKAELPPSRNDLLDGLVSISSPSLQLDPFGDWSMDSENSVVCRFDRLKQNMVEKVPPFFLTLRNPEDREPAELAAIVNAGDPPINEPIALSLRLTGH
jgi:hypothetical protein